MIDRRFKLDIDVYASDRPDLDNALKVTLDCLQSSKAIKNDRYCAEIHARKLIDKENPRIGSQSKHCINERLERQF